MRVDAVSAHADNNRIRLGYRIYSVAEPARFLGSARCIVFRIKPEHDVFPSIVAERMLLAVAPRQSESRSLLPFKIRHELPPLNYLIVSYHSRKRSINTIYFNPGDWLKEKKRR